MIRPWDFGNYDDYLYDYIIINAEGSGTGNGPVIAPVQVELAQKNDPVVLLALGSPPVALVNTGDVVTLTEKAPQVELVRSG